MTAREIEKALHQKSDPAKAAFYPRFFKTGIGEYGEGDKFIGVVVPEQRKIARKFKWIALSQIAKLLDSKFHECRLTALFILVHHYEQSETPAKRKQVYDFYLKKLERVNNWDLVDASCHKIMGPQLLNRSRTILYKLARTRNLWKNRAAIVTTYHFIQRNDLGTTLEISEILIDHEHDLIHKAVGWMLRELGKQNENFMLKFLKQHGSSMPRTMLRYAIEKLPKSKRNKILSGQFD